MSNTFRVLFLQEEIAYAAMDMLMDAVAELRLGNPMALSTDICGLRAGLEMLPRSECL